MAIVGLSTLASLTKISLNIALALYLVPPPIEIYPPLPAPYRFYIDLDLDPVPVPIPGLDRHQISDHQLFPPLLGFADGLIFLTGASIIPDSAWVLVQGRGVRRGGGLGPPHPVPRTHGRPCPLIPLSWGLIFHISHCLVRSPIPSVFAFDIAVTVDDFSIPGGRCHCNGAATVRDESQGVNPGASYSGAMATANLSNPGLASM